MTMPVPKEPWRLRAWRWVHAYASAKVQRHYTRANRHDHCCSNCRQWGAIVGVDWGNARQIDAWHQGLRCLGCGHETTYFTGALVPIPVEKLNLVPPRHSVPDRGKTRKAA